jgi:hypothetical protein
MDVQTTNYPIDIFTAHYRVSGEWHPRGNPSTFLNNESVQTLIIHDATVIPLRPGVDLEPILSAKLYLPKTEPQAIVVGNMNMDDIRPFPRRELLVCLTELLMMKGYFHLATESQIQDAFTSMMPQQFLFVSNLQIASLYAEATGVRANAMMAFVNKTCIRTYYVPETATEPG